jgi:carbamate kinase
VRVVAALGGNALLRRGEPLSPDVQRANVRRAAEALAVVAAAHELVVTHGNGPQVGLLALQVAAHGGPAWPLDVLGAESEGMIGYVLEQELANALPEGREICSLLTRTLVSTDDPAFDRPTKPVGPVYTVVEGARLAAEHGWQVRPDGDGVRRVVSSPEPLAIVEAPTVRRLVDAGVLVVCAGGGGIPVARGPDGRQVGVEAVVDKDRASAVLAHALAADLLLLLTDVDAVYLDWGTPDARPVRTLDAATVDPGRFAAGSMGPKIEAAARFVRQTGGRAVIGAMEEAAALVAGTAGTTLR